MQKQNGGQSAQIPEPVDDPDQGRFTVSVGGAEAELAYEIEDGRLLIVHTEVPATFRGRGVGGRLMAAAVAKADEEGLTIVPWCSFAQHWLHERPDRAGSVRVDFKFPSS